MAGRVIRVAVAQASAALFDRERAIDKIESLAAEAAADGARLALFPEAFVGGYPRGLDFGCVVGSRTDAGRETYRRYWESAVEEGSSATERLAAIARRHRLLLVAGVIERAGGTLYCAVFFFSPDGRLLGKRRKLMPTASERLTWGFGDGSTLTAVDAGFAKLGAVICWENYMPLLRAAMYAQGVEIYCAPTADARESWIASMRHVAREGGCFVLSANQVTRGRDCPDELRPSGVAPDDVVCDGGSCIVDPFGRLLAGPARDGETVLFADLDLDEIARAKMDFDVVGHYARPDVFTLRVNRRRNETVEFIDEDGFD